MRRRSNLFSRVVEGALGGLERGYAVQPVRGPAPALAGAPHGGRRGRRAAAMSSPRSSRNCRPTKTVAPSSITGNAPEGASFAYTQRYAGQVEEILAGVPELSSYLMIVGAGEVTRFLTFARLKDWDEREVKQQQITQSLLPKLRKIAGVQASASNPASLGVRGFGKPFQFVIQSSASYEEINALADKLVERLRDNPGLADLDTDMRLNKPEVEVEIDRDRVADLGLDISVIGRTLETLLGGRNVSTFQIGTEQYDVTVALPPDERTSPETLSRIFVRSANGEMVQLSNVVKARVSVAPRDLRRFNQLRAITIEANLAPGYTMGEAIADVAAAAAEVLPEGTAHRPHRPGPRVPRCQFQSGFRLRAGARLHLPRACRAVRKLPRSADDHGDRALVDDRRARRAVADRRHAERLFADRPGDAHRPDHQARHSHRRVHQQPAGRGPRAAVGHHRGGGAAPAADPDDDGCHDPWRCSAGARRQVRVPKAGSRSAGSSSAAWDSARS